MIKIKRHGRTALEATAVTVAIQTATLQQHSARNSSANHDRQNANLSPYKPPPENLSKPGPLKAQSGRMASRAGPGVR